jgi:ferredoxin
LAIRSFYREPVDARAATAGPALSGCDPTFVSAVRSGRHGTNLQEHPVMRVVVDFDLCESNAVCMAVAPEVFEVRDDDFLYVLDETPDESLRDKVEEAVRRCPKQAISLAED